MLLVDGRYKESEDWHGHRGLSASGEMSIMGLYFVEKQFEVWNITLQDYRKSLELTTEASKLTFRHRYSIILITSVMFARNKCK